MQLEVGNIVDGKVTGITNFGAFIALPEGKTGMIHISEISNSYVKDINDFLKDGEDVKVKILSIGDDGKIGLSIKTLQEENGISEDTPKQSAPPRKPSPSRPPRREPQPVAPRRPAGPPPQTNWSARPAAASGDDSFEDMLTKFKQVSNDRMGDLKRSQEGQRSSRGSGGSKSQ